MVIPAARAIRAAKVTSVARMVCVLYAVGKIFPAAKVICARKAKCVARMVCAIHAVGMIIPAAKVIHAMMSPPPSVAQMVYAIFVV